MYGVVNKALGQVICRDHGAAAWQAVCACAGVDDEAFVSAYLYPDEVTYHLVDAAASVLKVPVDAVLANLGEFWITTIAPEYYGPIQDTDCRCPLEFLQYLPEMQARLRTIFPEAQPAEFTCTDVSGSSLLVRFRSTAQGNLTPFVLGLIHGIARRFGADLKVELLEDSARAGGLTTFKVSRTAGG